MLCRRQFTARAEADTSCRKTQWFSEVRWLQPQHFSQGLAIALGKEGLGSHCKTHLAGFSDSCLSHSGQLSLGKRALCLLDSLKQAILHLHGVLWSQRTPCSTASCAQAGPCRNHTKSSADVESRAAEFSCYCFYSQQHFLMSLYYNTAVQHATRT